MQQLNLFGEQPAWPAGFRFEPELISRSTERHLLGAIGKLPLRAFDFHGYVGKRRTVSFGWSYDFDREALAPAEPIPQFLAPLQEAAAAFAGIPANQLAQVLVTEYAAGAGIGWHRDKGVFGLVIGVSLLSSCQFRLRRRVGESWERVTIEATPRSCYLLSGPARTDWEHSVPAVEATRFSITLRTLQREFSETRRQP